MEIATPGHPAVYTYAWYLDDIAVENTNSPFYVISNLTDVSTHTVYCVVSNKTGSVQSRTATLTVKNSSITYTYSGEHEYIEDEKTDTVYNWRIKLKSSGTLTISDFGISNQNVDVFCVGGGGSAGVGWYNGYYGKGASGGFTATEKDVPFQTDTMYVCTVGAGGQDSWGVGGTSDAFGLVTAAGGERTKGGSGGGAYGNTIHRNGGSDGSDGEQDANSTAGIEHAGSAGLGQHTTTREFGEITGDLYAGGGGSGSSDTTGASQGGAGGGGKGGIGADAPGDGEPNTGGGGGGCWYSANGAKGGIGGSGIIIIRNHRD